MATASGNVDLDQLTGYFDESVIVAYNICNISRSILNSLRILSIFAVRWNY